MNESIIKPAANIHAERYAMAMDVMKAYLQHNTVPASELPGLLKEVFGAMNAIDKAPVTESAPSTETVRNGRALSNKPVLPVKNSVRPDGIICLFDGVKKLMIKRHIRAHYGMEWREYLAHFNLPKDYPSVAPGYAEKKRDKALEQGLGSLIDKTPKHARATAAKRETKAVKFAKAA